MERSSEAEPQARVQFKSTSLGVGDSRIIKLLASLIRSSLQGPSPASRAHLFLLDLIPGVSLRSTPGFMLTAASRTGESTIANKLFLFFAFLMTQIENKRRRATQYLCPASATLNFMRDYYSSSSPVPRRILIVASGGEAVEFGVGKIACAPTLARKFPFSSYKRRY